MENDQKKMPMESEAPEMLTDDELEEISGGTNNRPINRKGRGTNDMPVGAPFKPRGYAGQKG